MVDADLGIGNAHILQGASPDHSLVDVVEGRMRVREVVCRCAPSVDLLPAGCGVSRMVELSSYELHLVVSGVEDLERDYGYALVDSAAGISSQTVAFAAASDLVLLVTTTDVTAVTDAYAFFKVLLLRSPTARALLLVNRAGSADEGFEVSERLARVARRFLGRAPTYLGWLPDDPAVPRSVNRRRPVVVDAPESKAASALREVADRLATELGRTSARGLGREMTRDLAFGLRAR